jgi:alkanesulfonate monooxygenase SsuD/methylene tetrahydromethanopterin reductase-like flavin-dependent oxidoreductase (luciferase family)
MFLGVLSGTPEHWAQYGRAYRQAWANAGHGAAPADIAVAVHGLSARTIAKPRPPILPTSAACLTSVQPRSAGPCVPSGREADLERGMVFAGGADDIAARIMNLQKLLGHSRQILQMDVGGMPHESFIRSIELLGRKVLPTPRAA